MADVQKENQQQDEKGFPARVADFLCKYTHKKYVLLKHQQLERELGKSISHAEFMRWFLEQQPDFEEITRSEEGLKMKIR